jgi:serine-type D-Ala-D-Ala carboxypeptidase (penicillin-binding protein 5/6)
MKKYVLIFIAFFTFFIITTVNVRAEEINENIKKPNVKAIGAVLIDANTGRVLWGQNEQGQLANASTTKIMTAILVLENANLNEIVTISSKAASAPKVKMFLKEGEKIKLEYLLYALMLQSSNDAAVAIAEHIGGDVDTFCKMMTQKAKDIGAKNTVFETPSGLDKGEHHSTAYDMAIITQYALNLDKFIQITNTPTLTASGDKGTYTIVNKNRLLKEYSGANGVKTGFTGKAGQCFVGAAKRGDMQLISVALGSGWGNAGKEQKWIDTKEMLNYGFDNYEYKDILTAGTNAGEVFVERSKTESIELYFEDGLMLPVNKEEIDSIRIEVLAQEYVKAPVSLNQRIGIAKIYIGEEVVKEVNVLTLDEAERHDLKTSLEKVINTWLELGTNEKVDVVLPEF